jgi:hypothetical protein
MRLADGMISHPGSAGAQHSQSPMNARGDAMIESTCASDSEAYGQYCSVMKISRVKKPTAWN